MTIEYENEDILIINKPAGVPVYSTKKNAHEESVLKWLLENYPQVKSVGDPERPGIIHRLDKQTSGLLMLAKTQAGFDFLKNLFAAREINKEYTALVYGRVEQHGVIDKPLTKIGHEGQSRVRVDEAGKDAKTEYWPLEFYTLHPSPLAGEGTPVLGRGEGAVDSFTLLRVRLHTGRTHQIRVHFLSEKHPVMGDDLYGKPLSQKLNSILPRQFLHASRLEFKMADGTWLEVGSELPEDLKEVINNLERITQNHN